MNVVFAGTPNFAAVILQQMLEADVCITLVMCQPDRPAGRGLTLRPGPVKLLAEHYKLNIFQPESLKNDRVAETLQQANADVIVVAAYGAILPPALLQLTPYGCVNLHASLLPRWRGAAPIHRAIEAGDKETGITVMQMDAGLDTGAILASYRCPIAESDTTGGLHDRLALLAGKAIVETLPAIITASVKSHPQSAEGITYAPKVTTIEAALDWNADSAAVVRKILALNPAPGARTWFRGQPLKVWEAYRESGIRGKPGEIIRVTPNTIAVACGHGGIWLQRVQRASAKTLPIHDWLNATKVAVGEQFGA